MRIAYLINRYPAVSHSFIRREICALERQGHEVLRLSIRGWNEPQFGNQDATEQTRTRYVLKGGALPLVIALFRILSVHPTGLLKAVRLVWQIGRRGERSFPIHLAYLLEACRVFHWLKQESVEHLHAHFGTNSAEVAMLVGEMGGPSWSFTVHGPEEFDKPNFIALGEKIRRAKFVVAVSSYGRSQLFRLVPYAYWKRIKVVHCGIEPAFYEDTGISPAPEGRRLICVGRLCEQKGQILLIEALHELVKKGIDVELVLAGDGEMRQELEDVIARHRLSARVRITGWIGTDAVREEILASRALIMPSFAEGLPVVIMEAMSLRRPVVSTYVAGIPELVQPKLQGWLVPAGDARALAEAMESCLQTPEEDINRMGEAARSRVLERHSIDIEARKLAALFQRTAAH
jgi:colanic acid/amylovoran biosynthesis glycosyltransferase